MATPEVHTPPTLSHSDERTFTSLLAVRVAEEPDRVFAEYKNDAGAWVPVTRAEFAAEVAQVAKGLIAAGVGLGDAVGLQSATRYEWAVADFAIQSVGAITVPIYPTSSPHQVAAIHRDAALTAIIVETHEHAAIARGLPSAPPVFVIDDTESPALAHLTSMGSDVTDHSLKERTAYVRADDVATIVYTSGTTGEPRGVALSHRAFVDHALGAAIHPDWGTLADPDEHGNARILLFLPLAHVLARHVEVLALACGAVLGFSTPKTIAEDLRSFQPTWLMAVPRVLDTFLNAVGQLAGGGVKGQLFRFSAGVSRQVADAEGNPRGLLGLKAKTADALVLNKVKAALGGRLRHVVCGGSRLSPDTARFFIGLGVRVMEGYGATETAGPLTCTPPSYLMPGATGLPYPGATVMIAQDGEVLAKGPNIFTGYWGKPDQTAAVMTDDGWYRTGDLGHIHDNGYLSITGRKKEILVTAGGKNVQPAGLEDSIRPDALVQEVVVVGDDRPFIAALIAVDEAMLPGWLAQRGLPAQAVKDAANHPAVVAHIQGLVDRANALVSRAEAIREWRVLPHQLTEQAGELSAALKVRRKVVIENFADLVTDIYATD